MIYDFNGPPKCTVCHCVIGAKDVVVAVFGGLAHASNKTCQQCRDFTEDYDRKFLASEHITPEVIS